MAIHWEQYPGDLSLRHNEAIATHFKFRQTQISSTPDPRLSKFSNLNTWQGTREAAPEAAWLTCPIEIIETSTMAWASFYQHGLTSIPAWISNHMPSEVWGGITYPFPNFNGCTVEV